MQSRFNKDLSLLEDIEHSCSLIPWPPLNWLDQACIQEGGLVLIQEISWSRGAKDESLLNEYSFPVNIRKINSKEDNVEIYMISFGDKHKLSRLSFDEEVIDAIHEKFNEYFFKENFFVDKEGCFVGTEQCIDDIVSSFFKAFNQSITDTQKQFYATMYAESCQQVLKTTWNNVKRCFTSTYPKFQVTI
jgi:hypothetical protein